MLEMDTVCHRSGGITKVTVERREGFSEQSILLNSEVSAASFPHNCYPILFFFSTIQSRVIVFSPTEKDAAVENIHREAAKSSQQPIYVGH